MRIKRLLISLTITSLCVLLFGCFLLPDQHYHCRAEDVQSVQIVRFWGVSEGEYDYTILCDVEDKDDFIRKLNDISQNINWGDSYGIYPGYIVIRVEYINGDCDLVYSNAQYIEREGKQGGGYACFNKEQFNALIETYLEAGVQEDESAAP